MLVVGDGAVGEGVGDGDGGACAQNGCRLQTSNEMPLRFKPRSTGYKADMLTIDTCRLLFISAFKIYLNFLEKGLGFSILEYLCLTKF